MAVALIRPEEPGDAPAIDRVVREAFATAPHASGTEHLIVRALRASGELVVSLVAVVEGRVVGHAAISPVTVADGSGGWFGLGPVAVLPDAQRRGTGAQLIERALAQLRAQGAAGCVVLGEPAYYGRFGFRVTADLVLEGVPPGYFQALTFAEGLQARGVVRYSPAFDVTS